MMASDQDEDEIMKEFYKYLSDVKTTLGGDNIAKLENLKTDGDRVDFAWNFPCVRQTPAIVTSYNGKCERTAERHRTQGNIHLKNKEYTEALESFNSSILFSTHGSAGHSMSYAYRSALLFHFERYRECITDIDIALEWDYPNKLRYKLYERRGLCYSALLLGSEAVSSFQKAKECLECSELGAKNREKYKKALDRKCQSCDIQSSAGDLKEAPSQLTNGELTEESDPTLPYEVRFYPDCGRYLTAKRDMKVGEVIFTERPYCSVLNQSYCLTHCQHCFRPVDVFHACKQCSSVVYCSEACRKTSWIDYHAVECQIYGWLGDRWAGHLGQLAFRITVTAGHDVIKKAFAQATTDGSSVEQRPVEGPTTVPNKQNDQTEQCPETYTAIFNLVGHDNDRNSAEHFQFTIMAVFLLRIMLFSREQCEKDVAVDLTEENKLTCVALMRHLKIVQCNGFSIALMKKEKDFRMCHPADVGMGIYARSSLVNHTCDPSMDIIYHGNVSNFHMIRDVKAGEELTIDYGKQFTTHPRFYRQKALQAQYFFGCRCVACMNDWPMFEHIESVDFNFLCQSCGRVLPPLPQSNRASVKCPKCNRKCNVMDMARELAASHKKYTDAMDDTVKWKLAKALPALQNHLSLMQRYIAPPWQEFYGCQAAIKQCYRLLSNESQNTCERR